VFLASMVGTYNLIFAWAIAQSWEAISGVSPDEY